MHTRSHPDSHLYAGVLLAMVMGGCSGPLDPATRPILATGDGLESGPSASTGAKIGTAGPVSKGGFYPLRVGNRWFHRKEQVFRVVPNVGDPPSPFTYVSYTQREIVCTEQRNGVQYLIERAIEYARDNSYVAWVFYRQDATGLYELDVVGTDPPPCQGGAAPGTRPMTASIPSPNPASEDLVSIGSPVDRAAYLGAMRRLRERMATLDALLRTSPRAISGLSLPGTGRPGELTRLRYPLARKARWVIRDDPDFRLVAQVGGFDVLNLPAGRLPGYRIRLSADVFGPHDVVQVWYGRSGYLQLVAHFEGDATDLQGNIIGRVVADEREALQDVSLVRNNVVTLPPWPIGLRK